MPSQLQLAMTEQRIPPVVLAVGFGVLVLAFVIVAVVLFQKGSRSRVRGRD